MSKVYDKIRDKILEYCIVKSEKYSPDFVLDVLTDVFMKIEFLGEPAIFPQEEKNCGKSLKCVKK